MLRLSIVAPHRFAKVGRRSHLASGSARNVELTRTASSSRHNDRGGRSATSI
jgi:hypothetical protein